MEKKRISLKWIALVFIFAATGAGILIGGNITASKFRAEQELNYRLNRSDLDGLGEIEGTIYVTGHKSPDSDTVGSSIAYAALLQTLGYDARPVVLGEINNETRYILETGGMETPVLLDDASGCNMVLVDHSEYTQSAEGLQDANVITIIDHHGDGSITTGNQLIYDARPLGSTATIVWIRYRNYGIEPDRKTAYAMVGSILSDTHNLQADTTTFADREAIKVLSVLAGINDKDALYQEMYQASISYDGMTDEEIFLSDMKEYEAVIRHVCRLANIFGTDRIRVFSFFEAYEARELVIAAMQRMVDIAAEYGLTLFHENEKDIYGDTADRVLDLQRNVKGLKFIYDPANFLQIGESTDRTLTEILPLCEHFHIKDYDTESGELVPAGMGSGEIGAIIDALCAVDGDAILVLEPHLKVFSGYAAIDGEPMKHRFDFETNRQAFDFAAKALGDLLISHGYTATKGGYVK
jgi:manganese-dependent inorganic pyrophosphatase